MSDRIEMLIDRAMDYASERSHEYVTLEHLLLSILQEQPIQQIIKKLKVDVDKIMMELSHHVDNKMSDIIREKTQPRKTQSLERVFNRAVTQVIFSGRKTLLPRDVLVSIMSEKESHASYFLTKHGLTRQNLVQFITKDAIEQFQREQASVGMAQPGEKPSFEQFCYNLNELAEKGDIDDIIGRETEIDDIAHILSLIHI